MAQIKSLFKLYEEDVLKNRFQGTVVGGVPDEMKASFSILNLVEIGASTTLFEMNDNTLSIKFDKKLPWNTEEAKLTVLFALTKIDKKTKHCEVSCLVCGNIAKADKLDIAYTDEFIAKNYKEDLSSLDKDIKSNVIFSDSNKDIIVVKSFPNSTSEYEIEGQRTRLTISVEDGKWVIKKARKMPLTKQYPKFLEFTIEIFDKINIKDATQAGVALDLIKQEDANGDTLLSLWKKYDQIESDKAKEEHNAIGSIPFKTIRHMRGTGLTRVQLHPNDNLRKSYYALKDELESSSFKMIHVGNEMSNDKRSFKVKKVAPNFVADLYDENYEIIDSGVFKLSLIGDDIVHKRRERALRVLTEFKGISLKTKLLLKNVRLAIEGNADVMTNVSRPYQKPITERTKKFLKNNFGIDNLTDDQKEAVSIAINTPDIALIQGPPGTGKTTVVATICDRLMEIAEKEGEEDIEKLILVSAFQNDTVEHTASKIKTFGLPTVKVGKESNSVKVEEIFANDMESYLTKEISELTHLTHKRKSKMLYALYRLYVIGKINTKELLDRIHGLIDIIDLPDNFHEQWKQIFDENANKGMSKEDLLLSQIPTTEEEYKKNGFLTMRKLIRSKINFSEEEKDIIEKAPLGDEPITEDFLSSIVKIKNNHTKDNKEETNNSNSQLTELLLQTCEYYKAKEENNIKDKNTFIVSVLEDLKEDLKGNKRHLRDTISHYSRSIAATNQLAGGKDLSNITKEVDNVILEEAARSNPLDVLIPMVKAKERIIMIGDQKQLPHLLEPDIVDKAVEDLDETQQAKSRLSYNESLFGRIYNNLTKARPKRTALLTKQFRMHPFIGNFISRIYYDNKLECGMGEEKQAEAKQHGLTVDGLKGKVAVFCNVPHSYPEIKGKSKSRPAEAKRIISLLDDIMHDPASKELSVGIITFYSQQVVELYKAALDKGYAIQTPEGDYDIAPKYKEFANGREKLRIGSVDSFQGKEFDVVILSTVRSNDIEATEDNKMRRFGFLMLENRLNVAFSRAQRLLIVVGDGSMYADENAKNNVEGLYEFYTNLSTDEKYGARIR